MRRRININEQEWQIIEKAANNYCHRCRLPREHRFYKTPESCNCDFHKMIKELKNLKETNNEIKKHIEEIKTKA